MQRIRARFKDDVIDIISPPSPGSAIVKGAVTSLALHPDAIVSRITKKTYGTSIILSFDEKLDPPEYLLNEANGEKNCTKRFNVLLRKGSQVEVDREVTNMYCPHSDGQRTMRFDLYSSTEQDPRYTVEDDTVKKEGGFTVTLPQDDSRNNNKLVFKFTMYFGRSSMELRAETQFSNRAKTNARGLGTAC